MELRSASPFSVQKRARCAKIEFAVTGYLCDNQSPTPSPNLMQNISSALHVNTHHGYLNTEIILQSKSGEQTIKDRLTGMEYVIGPDPVITHLSAGVHTFCCTDLEGELTIVIEDALKYGGGRVKKAFVFDKSPWAFVLTTDRLYAYNAETGEELVEHMITPDEIRPCSGRESTSQDYFIFRTDKDYSIYCVRTGEILITTQDFLFSNTHIVVYLDKKVMVKGGSVRNEYEEIVAYDFIKGSEVVRTSGSYSLLENNSILYYTLNDRYYALQLETGEVTELTDLEEVRKDDLLCEDILLRLNRDEIMRKQYYLFRLSPHRVTQYSFDLPFYISSYSEHKTTKYRELCDCFINGNLEIHSDDNHSMWLGELRPSIHMVDLNRLARTSSVNVCNLYGEDLILSCKPGEDVSVIVDRSRSFVIKGYNYCIHYEKATECPMDLNSKQCEVESKETPVLPSGTLCVSESGEKVIRLEEGQFIYSAKTPVFECPIFEKLYDHSAYSSAYFTTNSEGVVIVGNHGSKIIGVEDLEEMPFDVGGTLVAPNKLNGYRPEIEMEWQTGCLKPVWRDPVTLRRVTDEERSGYMFQSPDGRFTAKTNCLRVYENKLTGEEISEEEYSSIMKKYNFPLYSSSIQTKEEIQRRKEEKAMIVSARNELVAKYGRELLFPELYGDVESLPSVDTASAPEERIEEKVNSESLFGYRVARAVDYVICTDMESGEEIRVETMDEGTIRYLNYVSFSYDSRYLAYGARSWGSGVFGIFDLQKRCFVFRRCDLKEDLQFSLQRRLLAVWMVLFSKKGDMACYDSHPNTYVLTASGDNWHHTTIEGRSLLCFSPSGGYLALSSQGYIPYGVDPSAWGHQPSGNVYIHRLAPVDQIRTSLATYCDLGSDVKGLEPRAHSIASAAFSSDEKHFLVVGNDGVVVIRNLHLE